MNSPKDDLQHIRQMMERSSRFISLSGLSGVMAGVVALIGAAIAWHLIGSTVIDSTNYKSFESKETLTQLVLLALTVLALAICFGIWFTIRKSKKQGLKVWTNTTKQLLLHLSIPLIAGGVFCVSALYHGYGTIVAPTTLVFYGLALVNASKFTYSDIQYLGYCEIFLGLVAMFLTGYGLIFWALGFGVLHIVYGIMMYKKYDA